ncbi:hypothetical protein LBMAG53_13390 [Planctomycetota bacterium]|nr:hypothetical protein LBMAG53_13390 [Planctomycetota bacterium]
MLPSTDFLAHHAAQGGWTTFTCGRHGAGGGLASLAPKPLTQDLVIGVHDDAGMHVLPFVKSMASGASLAAFGLGSEATAPRRLPLAEVERSYLRGTDSWISPGFSFTIWTTADPLPDPQRDGGLALARACLPAIAVRLTCDNRAGTTAKRLVFAINPGQGSHVVPDTGDQVLAVGWGRHAAIAAAAAPGRRVLLDWDEFSAIAFGRPNHLGSLCGIVQEVPAGEQRTLDLVLCTHHDGLVTTGLDARMWYTRAYPTLQSVIVDALARHGDLTRRAEALDHDPRWLALDEDRRFLVAHAERSYWGNTWLLDEGGRPRWVVLEGEYAMHNTFDLTVDMVFYELARNPWTVRDVLDQFVERYSFRDTLARPAADAHRVPGAFHHTRNPHALAKVVSLPAEVGLPGGISFCHDMGVNGHFVPPGMSSYECSGLAGCFSHMTAEQLLNWILVGASYARHDPAWAALRLPIFHACLESLLNRDDPVPSRRTGVIGLDSERCAGGWEITTYDSLDPSLGQARNNLYLAVKGWAAWLGLELVLANHDPAAAATAAAGARRAADTIVARFDEKLGYIPAVFEEGNRSAIIPAVEGLIFPLTWGLSAELATDGPYGALLRTLRRHLDAVLVPGQCLFPDGGWKLSSTSDNSWASKIFICQVVAERVYGIVPDPRSHAAHVAWQVIGSADWAMTDQLLAGKHTGSRYYPRCVTADLWLGLTGSSAAKV